MPQASRTVVLIPKATYTVAGGASGVHTLDYIVIGEQYTAAAFVLQGDAATGTSPTLNVRIQAGFRDAAVADTPAGAQATGTITWYDWHSWTQITTGAVAKIVTFVGSGTSEWALTDGSLAANGFKNGAIPAMMRAKITITGTSASYANLRLVAQLLP